MKPTLILFLFFFVAGGAQAQSKDAATVDINLLLNGWHEAAATANIENYFDALAENAVFIGTDATENWTKKEFKAYATPYFKAGKAWNFKPLQRNCYFSADGKTAWFDELLDTQMKICRGSGVLIYINKQWKIAHYVLSMAIPNEKSNEVIEIKTNTDAVLMEQLRK